MGGPSAAVVLTDLAELGVRRAVRVGTCASLGGMALGELVVVSEAREARGAFASLEDGKAPGRPDPALTAALRGSLPEARAGPCSASTASTGPSATCPSTLAERRRHADRRASRRAAELGVAVAALLIVTERSDRASCRDEELEGWRSGPAEPPRPYSNPQA